MLSHYTLSDAEINDIPRKCGAIAATSRITAMHVTALRPQARASKNKSATDKTMPARRGATAGCKSDRHAGLQQPGRNQQGAGAAEVPARSRSDVEAQRAGRALGLIVNRGAEHRHIETSDAASWSRPTSREHARQNRSPERAVAHELMMAEPVADASLQGIAPGHQDEANHHSNEQRDHPGRPVEHKAPEWREKRPRR